MIVEQKDSPLIEETQDDKSKIMTVHSDIISSKIIKLVNTQTNREI